MGDLSRGNQACCRPLYNTSDTRIVRVQICQHARPGCRTTADPVQPIHTMLTKPCETKSPLGSNLLIRLVKHPESAGVHRGTEHKEKLVFCCHGRFPCHLLIDSGLGVSFQSQSGRRTCACKLCTESHFTLG
jgi:hypothetical protein